MYVYVANLAQVRSHRGPPATPWVVLCLCVLAYPSVVFAMWAQPLRPCAVEGFAVRPSVLGAGFLGSANACLAHYIGRIPTVKTGVCPPPPPWRSASRRGRLVVAEAPQHKFPSQIASATVSSAAVREEICSGYGLCLGRHGSVRRAGASLRRILAFECQVASAELGELVHYMRNAPTPEQWIWASGEHSLSTFLKCPVLYFWALFLKFSETVELRGLRGPRPP